MEGFEKSYLRPQLPACHKAALSLVGGDTVGSEWPKAGWWVGDLFKTAGCSCCAETTKAVMGLNGKQQADLLQKCRSVLSPSAPGACRGRAEFHIGAISNAKGGLPGIARFLSALRAACCTVTFPSSTCLSSRSISFWTMPLSTIWMQFPSVQDETMSLVSERILLRFLFDFFKNRSVTSLLLSTFYCWRIWPPPPMGVAVLMTNLEQWYEKLKKTEIYTPITNIKGLFYYYYF